MSSIIPLDDLLLSVCTLIELSDRDRAVADRRYALLQPHLERPSSPLREALTNSASFIYAQGSMAISATIVSGLDDDRFDVDAVIDMRVPREWSDDEVLDNLETALQGFPGVKKIVRCTRCVQLQFAFMHMDVTVLDAALEPRPERIGEIFHSPNDGQAYRVPSNPYGFSIWYRRTVVAQDEELAERLRKRRSELAFDRLITGDEVKRAEQEKLPPVIPVRLDAQQVVALKLLKRFINLRYCNASLKRPPSIYLTKKSADCGFETGGLTGQLQRLASVIEEQMREALRVNQGPREQNPSYPQDQINDRWPTCQLDRQTLANHMTDLSAALERAKGASVGDIREIFANLFGENVSTRAYDAASRRPIDKYVPSTGRLLSSSAVPIAARSQAIPPHHFHSEDDHS